MTRGNWTNYLARLLLGLALASGVYVGAWAGRNIMADYPMEYRENSAWFTSALQLEGKNPYAVEGRPVYGNTYGPGYFWVSYPFAWLFGNSYQTLRTVSVAGVLIGCGLLVWGLRIDGCAWWAAVSGGALLFSQLGQGLSITARPDGVGLWLFLGSLVIPYRWRFRPGSLAVGAALAILGYLTKPYFVLGLPLVCLYVFLFENKLKGLVLGVAGALGLLLSVAAVNAVYECYLTETFILQRNIMRYNSEHLARVGGQFVKDRLGLALIIAGAGICWISARRLPSWLGGDRNRAREAAGSTACAEPPAPRRGWFNRPVLAAGFSFPAFVLACNAAVMALALGLNPGNDVLYYQQLISPFLIWLVMLLVSRSSRGQGFFLLALVANVLWLGGKLPPWPKDHSAAWQELDRLIASHQQVFTAPHLSHLLARQGRPVYDAGQTDCAPYGFQRNPLPVAKRCEAQTRAFLRDIRDKVINEEFDLVLVCRGWAPLLPRLHFQAHYVCQGRVEAPMTFGYWMDPYPLEMWVPESQVRAGEAAGGLPGAASEPANSSELKEPLAPKHAPGDEVKQHDVEQRPHQ